MIKVLCVTQDPADSISLYRSAWPFSYLRETAEFTFVREVNWATIRMHDIVFVLRPMLPDHFEICSVVKRAGRRLWIDHDDDLTAVPPDNRWHEVVNDPACQRAYHECVRIADVVTVTTPRLQSRLLGFNKNTIVIPNAWDIAHFGGPVDDFSGRPNVISWRGSQTHDRDLLSIKEPLNTFLEDNKTWRMAFLGCNPWFLGIHPNRMSYMRISPTLDFLGTFRALRPSIHIVPLVDDALNRSKSNIAAIEATWAGAAVVAPDLPEFAEIDGVRTYPVDKPHMMKDILLELADNPATRKMCVLRAWESIKTKYNLAVVNEDRRLLIKKLAEVA